MCKQLRLPLTGTYLNRFHSSHTHTRSSRRVSNNAIYSFLYATHKEGCCVHTGQRRRHSTSNLTSWIYIQSIFCARIECDEGNEPLMDDKHFICPMNIQSALLHFFFLLLFTSSCDSHPAIRDFLIRMQFDSADFTISPPKISPTRVNR